MLPSLVHNCLAIGTWLTFIPLLIHAFPDFRILERATAVSSAELGTTIRSVTTATRYGRKTKLRRLVRCTASLQLS